MSDNEDWGRLARLAKQRRNDLGLTQLELASKASLSIDRIQSIENARVTSYSPRTLAKLERGLDWEPGSIRAILAGDDPKPVAKRGEYDPQPGEIERMDQLYKEWQQDPRDQRILLRFLETRDHTEDHERRR